MVMPTLKAYHRYENKNSRNSPYINTIIPMADRQVTQRLFDSFVDTTEEPRVIIDDSERGRDIKKDILDTTGAPE